MARAPALSALVTRDPAALATICDRATFRWQSFAKWRFLWTLLLFVFGAFLLLFAIGLIVAVVYGEEVGVIATAAATVIDGAAVKFVLDRRKDAVDEEETAFKLVVTCCGDQAEEAAGGDREAAPPSPPTAAQLKEARESLTVFGVR